MNSLREHCEKCSKIVFTNTYILNTRTSVQELPGSFVMMTNFKAGWSVINSDFK